MNRRDFLKLSGLFSASFLLGGCNQAETAKSTSQPIVAETSVKEVYMTKDISASGLVKVYRALKVEPVGKVAVKISTGEPGSNYLRPELIQDLIRSLDDVTIVECNTIYGRFRGNTESHLKVAEQHGFTKLAPVDIMDADGYIALPVKNGQSIKENFVGKNFTNYDYFLVVSHFKGHTMAGFGGAIKNTSIGIASTRGKGNIHGNNFIEAMSEAGKSVSDALNGKICYINVMNRLSLDCDCEENPREPDIHDIGILSSLDPVALDQACVDLIKAAPDGKEFVKQIEQLHGEKTLQHGEDIGWGSRKYKLVDIDA
ncbi:MAG: DUF362 domain-containing protein [Selenomonadaceae bacterium]|nr:DUF362 domain-containing protein [Selenomonadaceae bacterium]